MRKEPQRWENARFMFFLLRYGGTIDEMMDKNNKMWEAYPGINGEEGCPKVSQIFRRLACDIVEKLRDLGLGVLNKPNSSVPFSYKDGSELSGFNKLFEENNDLDTDDIADELEDTENIEEDLENDDVDLEGYLEEDEEDEEETEDEEGTELDELSEELNKDPGIQIQSDININKC